MKVSKNKNNQKRNTKNESKKSLRANMTATAPLISVIIPVYNVADYLTTCLKSICTQTFREIEIIAVDDASTDHSWTVLQNVAKQDARVRLFRHTENKVHPSYARNEAMKYARGKYIAFVDSDDFINPNLLRRAYELMSTQHADVLYCAYHIFSDAQKDKNKVWGFDTHKHKKTGARVFSASEASASFWTHFNSSACFKMYDKNFLTHYHFQFPTLYFEDLPFALKSYLKAKKIAYLPEAYYHYRANRCSTQKNRGDTKTLTQCLDGIRGLCALLDELSTQEIIRYKEALAIVGFSQSMRWLHDYLPAQDFEKYYSALRTLLKRLAAATIDYTYFTQEEKTLFQYILSHDKSSYTYIRAHIHIENATDL